MRAADRKTCPGLGRIGRAGGRESQASVKLSRPDDEEQDAVSTISVEVIANPTNHEIHFPVTGGAPDFAGMAWYHGLSNGKDSTITYGHAITRGLVCVRPEDSAPGGESGEGDRLF
ncbi:hypothetical protein Bbelb_306660 [Branchiostoma belcheri]|nr:hypothetical protein Bbelb_306660 [Branchiostoma belcheri]